MAAFNDYPSTSDNPIIHFGWPLYHFYMRGLHSVRAVNPCTLPPAGPAILVCNHLSGLDPLILQTCCPRLICWMMAREYYEQPALRWFFDAIGAIPVNRSGNDLAATRSAMRALESGRILGIFPQGRIGENGEEVPFQTGVALVAMKTGVPVYPAYLEGSVRGTGMVEVFLYPQRVSVAFGSPVEIDRSDTSRSGIAAATATIRSAVFALGAGRGTEQRQ